MVYLRRNVCARKPRTALTPLRRHEPNWTATTREQLPSSLNPTRTSETHTESGGRTVDNQSIETMGMYGRYAPYLDLQKETVKVDANTVRTIERAFGRDSEGRKTLVQVTEEEKRSLPGGEVKVVRTTSNPDANGGLQVVQREIQDTRQINPNVQETKSTFFTASTNGGLAASMQTTERRHKDRRPQRSSFASPLCCRT